MLISELDKIYKNYKEVEAIKTDDFLSFIDDYIQNTDKKKPTIKQYKIVRNNIFEYAELMRKRPTFNDIDLDYYLGFVEFLTAKAILPIQSAHE